ncbi:MAG: AAA family ATPase [Comamonadaceae bacterium]|nr:AAA family ATPase [Comamonadaceae bacterium]
MNAISTSLRSAADKLAIAANKAGLTPEALRAVRAWLADQLVAQQFAKLGQGGHTQTDVPLRGVFVDLPIVGNPSAISQHEPRALFLNLLLSSHPLDLKKSFAKKVSSDLASSRADTSDEEDEEESIDTIELNPMLRRRRLPNLAASLLIGGPGQGKSTLGQLACQLHRAALLKPVAGELSLAQRELLNSFESDTSNLKGQQQLPPNLPHNPLLPLQVALPDLSAWLIRQPTGVAAGQLPAILRFIADLPSAREHELSAETLLALSNHLPSLLVLDGFDEVGATLDRERIVAAARELLTALAHNGALSQVLATTRPQGYADELSQIGIQFQKLYLALLQKDEALGYAVKLMDAKIPGADARQRALAQLHAAAEEPATERLLTTPLQVTILAALVQQLGRAPRERWNLFLRYFDYTYAREVERNTYASALLSEHRAHIERIHARVALLLQVEAERHGGAAARMTRERLEEVIEAVLAEDEVAEIERKDLISDIATAAEQRLVFLVEQEPGKFGFDIRSLQEFMAARALTSGRDTEIESRFQQIAKAPMFRNVALFVGSRLFSEGSALRDVVADRICGSLDNDPTDELTSLTRAGALLALETLEEGSAISQPKRARALMVRATGLLALPPGSEHVRLARSANNDTVIVLREAIERCLGALQTGEQRNELAAWVCILDALYREESWAFEVGNGYWNSLTRIPEVLSACGSLHIPIGNWLAAKITSQSATISPESFIDLNALPHQVEMGDSWVWWLISVHGMHGMWRRRRDGVVAPLARERDRQQTSVAPTSPIPQPWCAWITAASYEVDPTADNLATVLDAIADTLPISQWKVLERRSSWPLGACLATANSTADLRSYSEFLRAKKLGDTADWRSAERAWKSKIDLLALLDNTSDEMPWTSESIKKAPPFLGVPVWRLIDRVSKNMRNPTSSVLLQKANHAFETSQSNKLRKRLAELCLFVMSSLSSKSLKSNLNAMAWINATPNSAGYLVPRPKALPIAKWIELLDACNSQPEFPWYLRFAESFFALDEARAHPVLLRLVILSIEVYAEHAFSFDLVTPAHIDSATRAVANRTAQTPAARADLAILQLFLGKVSAAQDETLFQEIVAAAATSPALWSALLSSLSVSRLPQPRVNALLAKAFLTMGSTHPHASTAIKLLRDALQKQTSDLDSHSTWNRLALPLPYPNQPFQPRLAGGIPATPVRIHSVELRNIRGLQNLSITFNAPKSEQGQWVVILGPNGSGKTTLLRSLTLALRSLKHPAIWPNGVFANPWQSVPTTVESRIGDSTVTVTLGDGIEHRTLIRPGGAINMTQSPEQDNPRLFPLFAYGCRRGSALGGTAQKVNLNEDGGPEIATLFDEGADLIQAETWLVALEGDTNKNPRSKAIYDIVIGAMSDLLDLVSVEVADQKVWVTERGHPKLPFQSLSDGYLTSAGWFLDLVARWVALTESASQPIQAGFLSQMRGLVLIDEIDLHLHPKWQIEIIARTRRLLPQMSFIVTTHNPLTLVGAEADEIWILSTEDGRVKATCGVETPMLLTGGQIYRRYFDIDDIYPDGLGRSLQRYSFLSGYALRNDTEQAELETLQIQLREVGLDPGWEVVKRTTDQAKPTEVTDENSPTRRKAGPL